MNRLLLITFLDVMETRNFNRTAERLNIMQSTVSARIRQLEESLGVRLFERGRGGAEPTAAGRRFETHAHAFLALWGHVRRDMLTGTSTRTKRLHISCQYSLVRSYLLDWAASLRAGGGDLSLHVEINFSAQIQRDILAGETDIGIMFAPQMVPDVQTADLGRAEFVMVSTETDRLDAVSPEAYVKVAYTTYLERMHDETLPHLAFPPLVIGSEDLGFEHLARHGGTLYLPRFAVPLAAARVPALRLVEDAPVLPQPVFTAVHIRKRRDPLVVWALRVLREIVADRN